MSIYHLHFKTTTGDQAIEHTRVVGLSAAIEYTSDIVDLQKWLAQEHGADSAVILNWKALAGDQRPLSEQQQAQVEQRKIDAQALAESVAAQAEPRSKKGRETLAASLASLYVCVLEGDARAAVLLTGVLQGLLAAGKLSEAQHAAQVERLQQLSAPAVAA